MSKLKDIKRLFKGAYTIWSHDLHVSGGKTDEIYKTESRRVPHGSTSFRASQEKQFFRTNPG